MNITVYIFDFWMNMVCLKNLERGVQPVHLKKRPIDLVNLYVASQIIVLIKFLLKNHLLVED